MYIIESIIKLINKYRKKPEVQPFNITDTEQPADEQCEHVFRPVDSTGKVLACIKCGFVVNMNNQNEDDL